MNFLDSFPFKVLMYAIMYSVIGVVIFGIVIGIFVLAHMLGIRDLVTATAILAFSIYVASERLLAAESHNAGALIQTMALILDRLGCEDHSAGFHLGLMTAILRRIVPRDAE